jgi:hypothetical protein
LSWNSMILAGSIVSVCQIDLADDLPRENPPSGTGHCGFCVAKVAGSDDSANAIITANNVIFFIFLLIFSMIKANK